MNEKVDCVKAEVAQGMADAKINTELALGLSEHDGCVADTSGNYSNVDYPMDFGCLNGVVRGHMQLAVWSEALQLL